MKIIKGNLLKIEEGIIVHQVNCQGVMGAGLALQIKNKWPKVFTIYTNFLNDFKQPNPLGQMQLIQVSGSIGVINLFGQDKFGKDGDYTSYTAHEKAWKRISNLKIEIPIYAPHLLGADLAGGDWEKIHAIAEKNVPDIIWVEYDEANK